MRKCNRGRCYHLTDTHLFIKAYLSCLRSVGHKAFYKLVKMNNKFGTNNDASTSPSSPSPPFPLGKEVEEEEQEEEEEDGSGMIIRLLLARSPI